MSITCREKLEMDHPEFIDEKWDGGCKDCPGTYGYRDEALDALCDCKTCNNDICTKCWDQPYEGELTPLEEKYVELKKEVAVKSAYLNVCRQDKYEANEALNRVWRHVGCGCFKFLPVTVSNRAQDIMDSYDVMEQSRNRWRAAWIGTVIGLVIGIIVRLSIGG